MEFHISRRARDKYNFDDALFEYDGNVIFANFHAVRVFAQKMNQQRDLISFPEQAVKASQLNAMGLIDEIFHHVFQLYREQKAPLVISDAIRHLSRIMTQSELDAILEIFLSEYPPVLVYKKEMNAIGYLESSTQGTQNRELILEELIMLWLAIENPALNNYGDLFQEKNFIEDRRFRRLITELNSFFDHQPVFGPKSQNILQMLQTPSIEIPDSITGQLEYIRENWASLLGDYLLRLLSSLDLIKEENKMSFAGPGKIPIPVYDQAEFMRAGGSAFEPEAFSMDREWMPRLVLIAKNSYVWLDQLSRKYERPITRLDHIPDEELVTLSKRGITGLWLIGLWERSPASAQIKKLCGNPEAISSAYSLHSYKIAADLGGDRAYEVLRDNAARYGIRLASDMVPNHMGIDSEWVIHNSDRFLALDHCPYPSYNFSGQDLSSNPDVTIQIEDHYFDRTDAAVVFKRRDNRSGQEKFVYHGNDGTTMPWNDTAQLNYLNPEVREAVIQTILEVAKKFPIIRFDAAMTLAKKHYQRLWFPQPGTGGAIPSRAEYGLTLDDFHKAMPVEFWREVVDRVAVEAPDTLLLAEAFWLMEGYFVRSLGMHRVYNSAFMNMLRNEDNAGYRKVIKNTLEFEPEILKRFVNFMNNPDERTAVDQFGKGDKYFGICMLMATMPGLPMLGHGQVEGFSEKYGMEFRKAYWDEQVDNDLVARHEWEIFPLLHQRRLFASVDNFWFYDFFASNGEINENVYAYSNSDSGKSALVLYNNNFHEGEGWIRFSVKQLRRSGSGKKTSQKSIFKALGLEENRSAYLVFHDQITGLSFLRPVSEIMNHGLHFNLKGYEHHAFLDFNLVTPDASHDYPRLFSFIGEQGVPDIERALNELILKPVVEPFRDLINPGYLNYLVDKYVPSGLQLGKTDRDELIFKETRYLSGVRDKTASSISDSRIAELGQQAVDIIAQISRLSDLEKEIHTRSTKKSSEIRDFLLKPLKESRAAYFTLIGWAIVHQLGKVSVDVGFEELSLSWLDEWQLSKVVLESLRDVEKDESRNQKSLLGLKLAIGQQNWYSGFKSSPLQSVLQTWLSDPEVQNFLQVNRYKDILWYNRESFDDFIWWMAIITVLDALGDRKQDASSRSEVILNMYEMITSISKIEARSGYQVEKLLQLAAKVKK